MHTPTTHLLRTLPGGARSAAVVIVAIAILLITTRGWWTDLLRGRGGARRWGVVVPGELYRSGQLTAGQVERVLAEHHIRVVIDMTVNQPNDPDQIAEAAAAKQLGIDRVRYPLGGDGTGDYHNYVRALEKIHEAMAAGEPVLVHCSAGSQRTGGVIALYQLLVEGRSRSCVIAELERYGWQPGHDAALTRFLDDHMAAIRTALITAGVIKSTPRPIPVLSRPEATTGTFATAR